MEESNSYHPRWEQYIRQLAKHHATDEDGISRAEVNMFKAGVITGSNDVLEDFVKSVIDKLGKESFTKDEIIEILKTTEPKQEFIDQLPEAK